MNGEQAAIRTLIVDDETPARQWLRTLCARIPDIRVVGECATASEASRALRTSSIDLLLLDIQLGAHTGFQVLDGVAYSAVPTWCSSPRTTSTRCVLSIAARSTIF